MKEHQAYEWREVRRSIEEFGYCQTCGTQVQQTAPRLSIQFLTTIKTRPVNVERSWTGLAQCTACGRQEGFDVDKLNTIYGEP